MHEVAVAVSILDGVRTEAARHGVADPVAVGVKVGALSCVDHEALRFAFEAAVTDTDLDGLVLEIERVPHTRHCAECDRTFEAEPHGSPCPGCGTMRTTFRSGDELEISYLEVEEPCRE